jgi:hypothetical protein
MLPSMHVEDGKSGMRLGLWFSWRPECPRGNAVPNEFIECIGKFTSVYECPRVRETNDFDDSRIGPRRIDRVVWPSGRTLILLWIGRGINSVELYRDNEITQEKD